MSKLIHVAGRPYRRCQKCRRCGYVLHDWNATKVQHPAEMDHYWGAGGQVIVSLPGDGYRTSYRFENAPAAFKQGAMSCDDSNTDRSSA